MLWVLDACRLPAAIRGMSSDWRKAMLNLSAFSGFEELQKFIEEAKQSGMVLQLGLIIG